MATVSAGPTADMAGRGGHGWSILRLNVWCTLSLFPNEWCKRGILKAQIGLGIQNALMYEMCIKRQGKDR